MALWPVAKPLEEIADEEKTPVDALPPACRCAPCDERHRADLLLARIGATQVTIVHTPKVSPEYKAIVSAPKGLAPGHGHTEPQAIFEALRALGVGVR